MRFTSSNRVGCSTGIAQGSHALFAGGFDGLLDLVATRDLERHAFRARSLAAVRSACAVRTRWESLVRKVLAEVIVSTIRQAVADFCRARSKEALIGNAVRAGAATTMLAAFVALAVGNSRRAHTALETHYRQRVQSVCFQSFQLVRAEQIWRALRRLVGGLRAFAILVLGYLQYVLGLFPGTRNTAKRLLGYILDQLGTMGWGIVSAIPDVVFLVILVFLTRYLLKFIYLFVAAVGRGEVTLSGFEREWADPTFKLLRLVIIALALVVAYPYVLGSGSDAFKGISIFLGIVFSLGSSSTIANLIAGYTMTYQRVCDDAPLDSL